MQIVTIQPINVHTINFFTCRTCTGNKFLLSEMKKEKSIFSTGRGLCNPCHTGYETQRRFRVLAEAMPENYLTCDGCDKIFSKFVRGTEPKHKKRELSVCCPYCKCEDISNY